MNNNQKLQPIAAIIDSASFQSDYLYGNSLTELKESLLEKNITLYALTKTKIQDYDFSKIFVISKEENDLQNIINGIEREMRKRIIVISKNNEMLSIFSQNGFQTCFVTEQLKEQKSHTYEINQIQKIKKLF